MPNTQHTKTGKESESKAGTLGDSTLPLGKASMGKSALPNSSTPITAITPNASPKIWTSAELEVLRSKAGLVAGALADWQTAGGLVVVKNVRVNDEISYPKIYLVADGLTIHINHSVDGIDFDLVAVGTVACDGGMPGA